jgi:DNA-binding MarR family transcriptional regulator
MLKSKNIERIEEWIEKADNSKIDNFFLKDRGESSTISGKNQYSVSHSRDLSEKTGLSLGMVNILLKKFIKKGFVKLERLNSKTFRYILTPEGFKEKSKKTIEYMKIYYRRTLLIKQNIKKLYKHMEETNLRC